MNDDLDFVSLMGPAHVDLEVRGALRNCWHFINKDDRTVDRVESCFRRIVERALKDFREDAQAFGDGQDGTKVQKYPSPSESTGKDGP